MHGVDSESKLGFNEKLGINERGRSLASCIPKYRLAGSVHWQTSDCRVASKKGCFDGGQPCFVDRGDITPPASMDMVTMDAKWLGGGGHRIASLDVAPQRDDPTVQPHRKGPTPVPRSKGGGGRGAGRPLRLSAIFEGIEANREALQLMDYSVPTPPMPDPQTQILIPSRVHIYPIFYWFGFQSPQPVPNSRRL